MIKIWRGVYLAHLHTTLLVSFVSCFCFCFCFLFTYKPLLLSNFHLWGNSVSPPFWELWHAKHAVWLSRNLGHEMPPDFSLLTQSIRTCITIVHSYTKGNNRTEHDILAYTT